MFVLLVYHQHSQIPFHFNNHRYEAHLQTIFLRHYLFSSN